MDEERRIIEELKKSGRITEEEAAELLKALGAGPEQQGAPTADGRAAQGGEGRRHRDDSDDWGPDVGEAIREGVDEGLRGLREGLEGMREGLRVGLGEGLREAMRGVREGLRGTHWGHWSGHEETVCLEHQVSAGCRVCIVDPAGDITVESGAPGVVRVEGTKSARGSDSAEAVARCSAIAVRAEGDREAVTVRVDLGPEASGQPRGSVDLEVEVPADATVEVRGGHGDVTVIGPTAALEILTTSGDIEIDRAGGRVKAATAHGDVTLEGTAPEAQLSAEHGDVTATIRPAPGSRSELVAGHGDIDLSLPADSSVALDLASDGGDVDCDLRLTATERRSERELVGRLGAGEAQIKARTGNGDITVGRS